MPKDRQRPEKSRSILSVGSLKLTATWLNVRLRHTMRVRSLILVFLLAYFARLRARSR